MKKMREQMEKMDQIALDREVEDTFGQIILACGVRPLKEKVTLLLLTVDYILENNKQLLQFFKQKETLH
jgi:hypothetical protein